MALLFPIMKNRIQNVHCVLKQPLDLQPFWPYTKTTPDTNNKFKYIGVYFYIYSIFFIILCIYIYLYIYIYDAMRCSGDLQIRVLNFDIWRSNQQLRHHATKKLSNKIYKICKTIKSKSYQLLKNINTNYIGKKLSLRYSTGSGGAALESQQLKIIHERQTKNLFPSLPKWIWYS